MYYLYGQKQGVDRQLIGTFDTEEQLLTYVVWATLFRRPDGTSRFAQGSALAGYQSWEKSSAPLTSEPPEKVMHNPSPSAS